MRKSWNQESKKAGKNGRRAEAAAGKRDAGKWARERWFASGS
jgi:hypothetical protein